MLPFIIGIQVFAIVFARIMGLMSSTTLWGSNLILVRFRMLLSFLITLLLFPMVREKYAALFPVEWEMFWFMILVNLMIGLLFGFMISMFFSIFQVAGQFLSFQIGFSMSQVLDPISQEEIPVLGQTLALLALVVFIALNGHLISVEILYKSFFKVPLGDFFQKEYGLVMDKAVEAFSFMFSASLRFSIVIIGSILIATLFVGLLAKASPQINAMIFGFPLYIAIGFLLLSFLAVNMVNFSSNYIQGFFSKLFQMVTHLK
ncbi:MAG TPA: flagellar biosynthetic protein FliR [Spirochaetia bacterium]|nr:MAG: flagellar biosynthetic protein FliR [Spirochaetes bacterium GWB1_36_13]HCL57217.1 flagellar biosynthetic protein FliR [Spirochaetia bacterium]